MVVDVGGGTSEMAVISLGGIVVSRSVRVGGYEMDDAIADYIRAVHQLAIGSQTAERIKIAIGSAVPMRRRRRWRSAAGTCSPGCPPRSSCSVRRFGAAIAGPLHEILQAIRDTLEETPPELASDIARDGILLAGGGTLIRGFDELVALETGMPVYSAESPLTCVAVGSGQALDHLDQPRRRSSSAPAAVHSGLATARPSGPSAGA